MEENMREIVLCIIVLAFSLTTHLTMAQPSNYGSVAARTHLVGRDGLCLDIVKQSGENYALTQLSPCESTKQSQMWTSLEDGTIRSVNNKYCLVPQYIFVTPGITMKNNVILGECNKWKKSEKIWNQKKDGTVVHVDSGLVLTARKSLLGLRSYVTLESNENVPSQSWEATEGFSATVAKIKWRENWCLKSSERDSYVLLNECSNGENDQKWALYGDGTIRVNDNRNYCLTSLNKELIGSMIVVSQCEDKAQQRWGMNAEDSNINHPDTDLVMDVKMIANLPPFIVIDKSDGTSSQQWTIVN